MLFERKQGDGGRDSEGRGDDLSCLSSCDRHFSRRRKNSAENVVQGVPLEGDLSVGDAGGAGQEMAIRTYRM